jgi:hypothetical protein
MSEISGNSVYDIAIQVAKDNTPEKCVGCHLPFLLGVGLGRRVVSGEITIAEATEVFDKDMDKCNFGRLKVQRTDDSLGIDCGHGQLCGTNVETAEVIQEHFWETFSS